MQVDREKPYIGVTGIDQVSEARVISQVFTNEGLTQPDSTHRGMVGLLVSQRILRRPTVGTSRYPSLTGIRQIFEVTQGRAFNTLHYSTYDESSLSTQLKALLDQTGLYGDELCGGVQLNMAWPPTTELEKTRELFPSLKIILQLGPRVLSERCPEDVVTRLTSYQDLIDYTLIDPSGGRGMVSEVNKVAPVYNQIRDGFPDLPIIFAGGFNARNVRTQLFLLNQVVGYNYFGIDAEKGLRVQRKGQEETDFSTRKATRYIHNAATFLRRQPNLISSSDS